MTEPAGGLDLVGAEEPSRHRAGEAGFYPEAIKAKADYNFDDELTNDSPAYITQVTNKLTDLTLIR
jgi:hypothetical protein